MGICDNTKNGNSDEEIKPQAQNKEHPFLTFKSVLKIKFNKIIFKK